MHPTVIILSHNYTPKTDAINYYKQLLRGHSICVHLVMHTHLFAIYLSYKQKARRSELVLFVPSIWNIFKENEIN